MPGALTQTQERSIFLSEGEEKRRRDGHTGSRWSPHPLPDAADPHKSGGPGPCPLRHPHLQREPAEAPASSPPLPSSPARAPGQRPPAGFPAPSQAPASRQPPPPPALSRLPRRPQCDPQLRQSPQSGGHAPSLPPSFLFFLVKLLFKSTFSTIHPFNGSMAFGTFTKLCDHHF